jgi:hypothetical protein
MPRSLLLIMITGLALLFTGCTNTTAVKQLSLPPVTTIAGFVNQLDEDGFVLADDSGTIYVHAKPQNNEMPSITVGEKLKVYGNLRGGQAVIFDAYVITRASGKQMMLDLPSPHIGCVIQTRFE